jgi:predicted NBD/HSP70 family sugar kinase
MKRVDLSYARLASSEVARDMNRDVVLELIRTRQPVSRSDLSRLSGLQPSTISSIVEQLLEEKWITEGAAARRPRGRRPTLLSLNSEIVMIVVDIRPQHAILAVVDLNGRFLSRETLPLVKDPAIGVETIATAILRMMKTHPDKSFEGIGISLPGRVDPASQRLIFAPNLHWQGFDIKTTIEKRIGLQVEMDNAANACLLSELWFGGMDGVRNAVLITISEGIGAAILANGQLVNGASGMAGEFGHIQIDPLGPLCNCGRKGCWEVFASSRAAISYYMKGKKNGAHPSILELLNLAEEGDKGALEALTRQTKYLAHGLRMITSALSPEVILFTGGVSSSWKRFRPLLAEELAKDIVFGVPPRLEVTNDAELARLRGAAALVLQRHTGSNRPSVQPDEKSASPKRKQSKTRSSK